MNNIARTITITSLCIGISGALYLITHSEGLDVFYYTAIGIYSGILISVVRLP